MAERPYKARASLARLVAVKLVVAAAIVISLNMPRDWNLVLKTIIFVIACSVGASFDVWLLDYKRKPLPGEIN